MAGITSPNVPQIQPDFVNGIAQNGGGQYAGLPNGQAGNLPANILPSHSMLSADTNTAGYPQTVAPTAFHIAAIATALQVNTATSTAGAATSNTVSGRIITEALTTAVGANYTMTLTNSTITAAYVAMINAKTTQFLFDIRSGTNTNVGMVPLTVTVSAGSVVMVFQNQGTAALNGTMIISWHT